MSPERHGRHGRDVQYFVLPDPWNPWFLAQVRWPDMFCAISPGNPEWQADPGLFDLPYDRAAVQISAEQAAVIATSWGAELRSGDSYDLASHSLIRRMPPNWSALSPAEKRAWNLQPSLRARRGAATQRRRWSRRTVTTAEVPVNVIDLTSAKQSAPAGAGRAE